MSSCKSNNEPPAGNQAPASAEGVDRESQGNRDTDLKGLRHRALCDLALWSHPAWIQPKPHSMFTTAAMQWVAYHRTQTAARKLTVAEIIGGVRGIIPQSRLATYGDFRYDIDHEDLYVDEGRNNDDSKENETSEDRSTSSEGRENYLGVTAEEMSLIDQLYAMLTRKSTTQTDHENKALGEWLKKVEAVLVAVKGIANFYSVFHSQTDSLLKTCLKFVGDARRDLQLSRLMHGDVAFVELYDDLLRENVSKIELHSIPQPVPHKGPPDADDSEEEDLWLRLTSMEVRRLWKENTRAVYPHEPEYAFLSEQYPLIWLNFLRKEKDCYFDCAASKEHCDFYDTDVEVPSFMEGDFLADSLLRALEDPVLVEMEEAYAGGDSDSWTSISGDTIPPPYPPPAPVMPPANCTMNNPADNPVMSPMRLYQVVPPPPVRVVPPPPPYAYHQPMRMMPGGPGSGVMAGLPQQVQQFVVPRAPLGCVPMRSPPISLPLPSYANVRKRIRPSYATALRREHEQLLQSHRLATPHPTVDVGRAQQQETTQPAEVDVDDDPIGRIPLPDDAYRHEPAASQNSLTSSNRPKQDINPLLNHQMVPFFHPMHQGRPMMQHRSHQRSYRLSVSQYLENNFQRYRMLGLPPVIAAANYPPLTLKDVADAQVDSEDKVEEWLESNKGFLDSVPDDADDSLADVVGRYFFGSNFLQPSKPIKRKKIAECLVLPGNSLSWLKTGHGLEGKIEFLRKVLAEAKIEDVKSKVSSRDPKKGLDGEVEVLRKVFAEAKVQDLKGQKKRSASVRSRTQNCRRQGRGAHSRSKSDGLPRMSVECQNCRTVLVENSEFNSFPSKRIKRECVFEEPKTEAYSSTREYDEAMAKFEKCSVEVQEVLFSSLREDLVRTGCWEDSRGWDSFELAVKTVMRNLDILIKNRHSQEIQHWLIKV